MKTHDLSRLSSRLNELAEYYSAKFPSNAAMKVWLDALAEVSIDDVEFVLTDWPKSKPKFPMAAEVLTLARTRISDRLEKQAERHAREGRERIAPPEQMRGDPNSSAYLRFKEEMRILAEKPEPNPKSWAVRYVARCEAGDIKHPQLEMLAAARKIVESMGIREPGEEG